MLSSVPCTSLASLTVRVCTMRVAWSISFEIGGGLLLAISCHHLHTEREASHVSKELPMMMPRSSLGRSLIVVVLGVASLFFFVGGSCALTPAFLFDVAVTFFAAGFTAGFAAVASAACVGAALPLVDRLSGFIVSTVLLDTIAHRLRPKACLLNPIQPLARGPLARDVPLTRPSLASSSYTREQSSSLPSHAHSHTRTVCVCVRVCTRANTNARLTEIQKKNQSDDTLAGK